MNLNLILLFGIIALTVVNHVGGLSFSLSPASSQYVRRCGDACAGREKPEDHDVANVRNRVRIVGVLESK